MKPRSIAVVANLKGRGSAEAEGEGGVSGVLMMFSGRWVDWLVRIQLHTANMQDYNTRGKAVRTPSEKKEEMSFEKYGEHLKNELEQISKLIGRKHKSKREDDLSPAPGPKKPSFEIDKVPPKGNATSSILEQSPTCESRDSERENKRNFIYDTESYKEVGEPTAENGLPLGNEAYGKVFLGKSPYSETMSTASSHSKAKKGEDSSDGMAIGDFVLGKKLGSGKFGEVFVARHKKTGFICALKRIAKGNMQPKLAIQLVRQIKIQSFLNHPNIVRLYTFFADEQYIYLVQELCCSGQLYTLLKKKRKLSEDLVKAIVQQICRALDYMHECEIIHRDLKPENIIYQNGLIKICDFGWSISSKTMRETFCGTPLYVSPELLKRKNYNNKIDVWSVGVLTYELLFGRVPFEIVTERDFIKIIEDDIKFTKAMAVSDEAKDFVLVCLKKDPRDRYTVPQLLEHPFISVLQSPVLAELY